MAPVSWEQLRERVAALAEQRGHLAGYPFPVEGHPVSLSPRVYPELDLNGWRLDDPEPVDDGLEERETIRNEFWSNRLRTNVWIVWRGEPGDPDFRVEHVYSRWDYAIEGRRRLRMLEDTIHVAVQAWELEAELTATAKLLRTVSPHQFKAYMLTGCFIETSKRSGVSYLFRKLRPTIALSSRTGRVKPLCALCLHPLAYYDRTFAGGMVPTDDVIAHLLLMRADEHRFWKQANQHSVERVEAGI